MEKHSGRKKILTGSNVLAGLILMCCVITLSVTIVLNFRPLYYMDVKLLHISESSGYSEQEIRRNYDALIDYNNLTYRGELVFPTMPLSETARIHFREVKNVFAVFEYGAILTLLLSIVLIVWKRRRKQYGYLAVAAAGAVGLPAVLGLLIAVNWQWFFVTFHELVFRNDYWLFDPVQDPIITVLPDAFFMHCALMILGLAALGSLVCFGCYRRLVGKT